MTCHMLSMALPNETKCVGAAECEFKACWLRAFIDNDTWQYYHKRNIMLNICDDFTYTGGAHKYKQ